MTVRVKLFAILRDRVGASELSLDLPGGSTVSAAIVRLSERVPAIRELVSAAAIAVNREYVKPDHVLKDNDELALIPPVSGGRQ